MLTFFYSFERLWVGIICLHNKSFLTELLVEFVQDIINDNPEKSIKTIVKQVKVMEFNIKALLSENARYNSFMTRSEMFISDKKFCDPNDRGRWPSRGCMCFGRPLSWSIWPRNGWPSIFTITLTAIWRPRFPYLYLLVYCVCNVQTNKKLNFRGHLGSVVVTVLLGMSTFFNKMCLHTI